MSKTFKVDFRGRKYGRLTVVDFVPKENTKLSFWLCRCECGNEKVIWSGHLTSGDAKSCGCLHDDLSRERLSRHGKSRTRLYKIWENMINRCSNPCMANWKYYGGRGIDVCEEWRKDFMNFYEWAISSGYDENAPKWQCTIDRIDVNGNYEPNNCKWSTMKEQSINKRKRT